MHGVQKGEMNLTTAGKVWVTPSSLSVSTTQPAFIEWQSTICRSSPTSQHFGAKNQKQPLRRLSTTHQLIIVNSCGLAKFKYWLEKQSKFSLYILFTTPMLNLRWQWDIFIVHSKWLLLLFEAFIKCIFLRWKQNLADQSNRNQPLYGLTMYPYQKRLTYFFKKIYNILKIY